MKRSLAPPRRDKPAGYLNSQEGSNKKLPIKSPEDKTACSEKSSRLVVNIQPENSNITNKFEEKYRNKNLDILSTPLLIALSTLNTLDISYNHLNDSQIELIMNSCTKLSSLCIQGNLTSLVPAAISKLKLLVNFRHDWVKLYPQEMYEPENRLDRIREIVKKPEIVTKIGKIVGLDFVGYCQNVLEVVIDKNLLDKVEKCDFSAHAHKNIMKYFEQLNQGRIKEKERLVTIHEGEERSLLPGCFGICNFEDRPKRKEEKWKEIPHIKDTQSEAETDAVSTHIKIEDIRDITSTETEIFSSSTPAYTNKSMPLHFLFANFDNNPNAHSEIDGLLLQGYNPNQYDSNGLSAYHLCVIHGQKKGLEYLLEIAGNNPGFFDLEMPSIKEGRNLLHFCVFLKNFSFMKSLLEFGLPPNKRDSSGARITHLVDQNYEFLILLRKLLKKKTASTRSVGSLYVPQIPLQNKKNYVKHPQRQREEARFRITYSKNDRLLEMYENAVGNRGIN